MIVPLYHVTLVFESGCHLFRSIFDSDMSDLSQVFKGDGISPFGKISAGYL